MSWYCAIDGRQLGPFSQEQVRAMIQSGQLRGHDLAWNASHGPSWVRVDSVSAFAPFCAPAALPPPAPPPVPAATTAEAPPWSPPGAAAGAPTANVTLMAEARALLAGRWGEAIGAAALLLLVGLAASSLPYVGWILAFVVAGPVELGTAAYFLATARRQAPTIARAFSGFERFGPAFVAYMLVTTFIFLWSLLLIVPGIMAACRYSMTFFILEDDPRLTASQAIERSMAMMEGHKWRLCCLYFRFTGWALLTILTFGLGLVVLLPYVATAKARFYEDLRGSRPAV